jgi:DNA-binding response OmpR family regulator
VTGAERVSEDGAPPPVRALVVEDDTGIAQSLVRGLERAGYTAQSVATGSAALEVDPVPDIVLLDLGLPDMDGLEVCRLLRRHDDLAIIVVTARGEECDRVAALGQGADDYLVKPFGLAELLDRIRAVLNPTAPVSPPLRYGPLALDARTRTVTVADEEIALTPKEFDVLKCLVADPGRVVTREEILERAGDGHRYGSAAVLDVHMAGLRRKLNVPGMIETIPGQGFRLTAPN